MPLNAEAIIILLYVRKWEFLHVCLEVSFPIYILLDYVIIPQRWKFDILNFVSN